MTDLFSTPASHAFDHPELEAIQAGPSSNNANGNNGNRSNMNDTGEDMSVEEAFEVDDTVRRIFQGRYKTVGLQFPDELLPQSVEVFKAIQRRIASTGAQAYVLADSTYGSCCPDVLSCLHLPADFLVHYGHACLTPTDALPVHYVFPKRKLDVRRACRSLLEASSGELESAAQGDEGRNRGIIIVWDVAYDWLATEIQQTFKAENKSSAPLSFAHIHRPSVESTIPKSPKAAGKAPALRSMEPPEGTSMEDCVIWYVGEEGRSLLNLQMTHSGIPLYSYSPSSNTAKALHPSSSRLLSRRLYAVHQAMSSDVFGLIVGNVGLTHSQPLLAQLRGLLRRHRKKSYTLSVGRLNPAKLANFETVECFVLVGCAEGGIVDSKDFYRPIITPWELLLALQGPEGEWEPSKWTLDISSVLRAAAAEQQGAKSMVNGDGSHVGEDDAEEHGEDDPQFSLVTGTLRSRKVFGGSTQGAMKGTAEDMQSLSIRNTESSLVKLESAGSEYLKSRHFQGLDPREGAEELAELEQGRSGIARGYEEEK